MQGLKWEDHFFKDQSGLDYAHKLAQANYYKDILSFKWENKAKLVMPKNRKHNFMRYNR